LKKLFKPEFVAAITRKPKVYRGLPFLVEVAIAYGGEIKEFKLLRYANKVPLLYDQSACAITEAIKRVNWKNYGINQDKSGLPEDKIIILVHVASVWIPFTSESKYAIAHYDEIIDEIVRGLQEIGRKFKNYLQKKKNLVLKLVRRRIFEAYSRIVSTHLKNILINVNEKEIRDKLLDMVEKKLGIERAIESLEKLGISEEYIREIILKEMKVRKTKRSKSEEE